MSTLDRLLSSPKIRAVFGDPERDLFCILNILKAIYAPILKGDKYLDGFHDWDTKIAETDFRKDFHSNQYLKIPDSV